ncbi:pif1, partial [Symbiodinium sp. CCMP2456]
MSIIMHLGETPHPGHYVAYVNYNDVWWRCDDRQVMPARDSTHFCHRINEKAYHLFYQKTEEHEVAVPAIPRAPIDLEINESDSDVVEEFDHKCKNSSDSSRPEAKRPREAQHAAEDMGSDGVSSDAKPQTAQVLDQGEPAQADDSQTNAARQDVSEQVDTEMHIPDDLEILLEQEIEDFFAEIKPAKRPRGQASASLRRYTEEERQELADIVRRSISMKHLLASLTQDMPMINVQDPDGPGFLRSQTLRRWFNNHAAMDRAMRAAQVALPKSTARQPPSTSTRARLSDLDWDIVKKALAASTSTVEVADKLGQQLSGFSSVDKTAAKYVPRATLHRWLVSSTKESTVARHRDWSEEYNMNFSIGCGNPSPRPVTEVSADDANSIWLQKGSWTFCPDCGRRRTRTKTKHWSLETTTAAVRCADGCDPDAWDLLEAAPQDLEHKRLRVYVTPQSSTWMPWLRDLGEAQLPLTRFLTKTELKQLAVLEIQVEYRSRRGGNAEITSKQKVSLTRCRWARQSLREMARDNMPARAFTWLLQHNTTYKAFVDRHDEILLQHNNFADGNRNVHTAEMLLNMPGIEVAARPWLYPTASCADSDLQQRLLPLGWTQKTSKPSLRAGIMRKLSSRCVDYVQDFPLQCLFYDVCVARTITSIQSIADAKKTSPDQIALDMDTFDVYWLQQVHKMEDICRQEFEKAGTLDKALPSIFFTVAPAEWKYLLQEGMFHEGSLSDQQANMTLHLYNSLQVLLEYHILKDGHALRDIGVSRVRHWSIRFEFQARGTLHLHAVLWADLLPGWQANNLTGCSGTSTTSKFVRLLESLFRCRVDVQCGDGHHNLLMYVAGYVSKASDALTFYAPQATREGSAQETSKWRQTYRLLCKKSPMEQEMLMEFAGLPMVKHSFSGVTLFAPIPGSRAANSSRDHYNTYHYQFYLTADSDVCGCSRKMSYMQWLRRYRVVDAEKKIVRRRTAYGPAKDACAIAMSFPFELLDIYVGAYAASFLEGMPEYRLLPDPDKDADHYDRLFHAEVCRRKSFAAPEGCRHLKAVLCLDEFQQAGADPMVFNPDDPAMWTARRAKMPPQRSWSPEQQDVLNRISIGTNISDAASMEESNRILHVCGGPGTGKTEVVIAAARQALDDGCRVLIAGPIGLLVSMYRKRLPATDNLTMETLHSAFRIVRDEDAAYSPPGRLRRYDLIIIDEVSQIDGIVWGKLKTALGELAPCPFIVFVGDFQQLQPLGTGPVLQNELEQQISHGKVVMVRLLHHQAARSVDPAMLDFLEAARVQQPSRQDLIDFFQDRVWPSDLDTVCR